MSTEDGAPRKIKKDWRVCFTDSILRRAEDLVKRGRVHNFVSDERSASASFVTSVSDFSVQITNAPDSFGAEWDPFCFSCNCGSKYNKPVRVNGGVVSCRVCVHEAATLLYWEQQHGPWEFAEPPEIVEQRLAEARRRTEEALEKKRIAEEKKRREKLRAREEKTTMPAHRFFPDINEDNTVFNLAKALAPVSINLYCKNRAAEILEHGTTELTETRLMYDEDGEQVLAVKARVDDGVGNNVLSMTLGHDSLKKNSCSCMRYWFAFYARSPLCEHQLAALVKIRELLLRDNPGDLTDQAANKLFEALDSARSLAGGEGAEPAEKHRGFVLEPLLTIENGEAELSYRTGFRDGRMVMLRSPAGFLRAVEQEAVFSASKAISVNFSEIALTEDSLPWLELLRKRVEETEDMKLRLQTERGYHYFPDSAFAVGPRDKLRGSALDRFYDTAEGGRVNCQNKDRGTTGPLSVGHTPARVRMTAEKVADSKGGLIGVEVRGEMPVLLQGSAASYSLDENGLSRISKEDEQALSPYRHTANASGRITFRVGKNNLAEFYYRVVPQLLGSPCVEFEDRCFSEAEALLPPEPAFLFRMDLEDNRIWCEATVSYGADRFSLYSGGGGYRDGAQEQRVMQVLERFFPEYQPERDQRFCPYSEENLYVLLTEGVHTLSRFGEAQGSEALQRIRVRSAPDVRVGVSIESGLLDISVLSRELSPKELLEVLASYREKKRFHRLRSGDYLSLSESEGLFALDSVLGGMDLDAAAAVSGGVKLPAYRALYLGDLLEKQSALSAERSRTYRALLRSFQSIRDADYEVPEGMKETLRPYQVHGYKWLRTLSAAGFGGILADEMGLGKTVQTIAYFRAVWQETGRGLFLVVCPASVVFNWQEEVRRFAPELPVLAVAGGAAARQELLSAAENSGEGVLITSYDLARVDIERYRRLRFTAAVLDEAQYIKNQKAAVTKAVKQLNADCRFALTGTPIENRLAELWSIFDYLMPGFLYTHPEFSSRFESPITRNHDAAATERLKRMTRPFILRRLKGDVLKDLPAKLEEVRYSLFEEEQRKLYDAQVVRMKQLLGESGEGGQDRIRILAELTRIRQICCDPSLLFENYRGGSAKRAACLELVKNAIGGGHRMLVFSQFTSMLALLEEDLRRNGIPYYIITGSTNKEQRLRMVRSFNEGDTPVFLVSLKAGGTGLNLTGADMVIHYDPWWNQAAQNQATDRAHRIGQTRQVTVYRLIAKGTIEEKILALQEAKRDLADAILAGEAASLTSLSNEELLALLD